MRPTSAFSEQDGQLFEDAVDFVADPDALTGRWADDWQHDMRGRVAASDLIALVSIPTLQTATDPQQRTSFRLSTTVLKTMKGNAPADLTLSVADDAPGYSSIEPGRARLNTEQFVVFAKYYTKTDGSYDAHWHLSISSPQVAAHVRAELGRDVAPSHTVIKTTVVKD